MPRQSVLISVVLLAACGRSSEVDDYISELPPWSEFSPTLREAPAPVGEPESFTATGELTEIIDKTDGSAVTKVYEDVEYDCTTTDYSMTDTPSQFVSYSPDAELLYPGALIQGRSHRDGVAIGSILPLPIDDRTPIRVSIPAIPSGDNFREIERPNQAEVAGGIGEMVGNATVADLSTPSTIDFHMARYHDESEFALSIGISGRYLGFQGSSDVGVDQQQTSTTVTAHFFEKMFEVVVEPPTTPGAFFSDSFTSAKLQEQVDLGRIGQENLPIYVSNVVYGRMLTYSVTSSASEAQVTAALDATFRTLGQTASVELSAEHRLVLESAEISVKSLGGDSDNVLELIRSGDLRSYFDEGAPLSSAAPLSYTFRNLGDGSIASVAETTRYSVTECEGEAQSFGYIHPDERVVWLDRMEVLDDSCEQGPTSEIALEFLFTADQGGTLSELIDRRNDPWWAKTGGVFEFDRASVPPIQFAFADGTVNTTYIKGDAWRLDSNNPEYEHFIPVNEQNNTWILTFDGEEELGEHCHRRRRDVEGQGDCWVQLYLCVVNGNEQSYDERGCVNPDPDGCLL
ncbi:MAG: thiol-activated cytolysin family protein [Myxococcales bacterium]|nr:thiol-activated cytolysin family protein [Myxococcales bacterium]